MGLGPRTFSSLAELAEITYTPLWASKEALLGGSGAVKFVGNGRKKDGISHKMISKTDQTVENCASTGYQNLGKGILSSFKPYHHSTERNSLTFSAFQSGRL